MKAITMEDTRDMHPTQRQQVSELLADRDRLRDALRALFALHEPEGRFQPSHYKPALAKAREALGLSPEDARAEWLVAMDLGQMLITLEADLETMPPANAMCHNGIVEQAKCGHCQRIARSRESVRRLKSSWIAWAARQ